MNKNFKNKTQDKYQLNPTLNLPDTEAKDS